MVAKRFSTKWKSSTQTRKQRKYRHNAPNHIRHKFMSAPLSSDLRKTHGIRNISVRSGDTVTITTGQFKGHSGKVASINLAKVKVKVEGAELMKRDGTKVMYPINPSNVMITKLDLSDELRKAKIEKRASQKKESIKQKEAKN